MLDSGYHPSGDCIVDQERLRDHVRQSTADPSGLTARIFAGCWPGGADDRLERAALPWVRLWRPARAATPVPVCDCAAGHCDVCN
jgi:hypothetical protein